MSTVAYALPLSNIITNHWRLPKVVRDGVAESRERLEVLTRSGDYFITLATTIDQLSKQQQDPTAREALQTIVSELLYLQVYYTISKKQ